jgi:cytidine deaminase
VAAVAQFGPGIRVRAVVVVNSAGTACQPCGACRQTIFEFSTAETWVFYPAAEGALAAMPIAALLPAGFSLEPVA